MSGFEIAGLVLGAVPIMVEALKAYSEAREFLKRYRTKNVLVALLIQDLLYYRLSINEQVGKVLGGSGVSVSENDFQTGRAVTILQDASQNQAILHHLGEEKFHIFVSQLKRCQGALAEIISQFKNLIPGVVEDMSVMGEAETLRRLIIANEQSPGCPWKLSRKRLEFSYRKADLDKKMRELQEATQRLKDPDLHGLSGFAFADSVPGEISSRAIRSLVKSFDIIQRRATYLHHAFAAALASPCHQSHGVHLFLEERIEVLRRSKTSKHTFNVRFFGSSADSSADFCHQCEINTADPNDATFEEVPLPGSSQVRFSVRTSAPVKEKVVKLCVCLQNAALNGRSLDLVLSDRGMLYYSELDGITDLRHQASGRYISLAEAISHANESLQVGRTWGLKQRMVLALRLACSVAQLNRTHWLASDCRASSIYFRWQDVPPSPLHPPFEADLPFVRGSHLPEPGDEGPTSRAHALLLDLATVLLELWSVIPFMHWYAGSGRPAMTQMTHDERRQAADAWLTELEPNLLPSYKRAVGRCIEMASRTSNNFDSEDFREDFCEGVIKPLWENAKLWLK